MARRTQRKHKKQFTIALGPVLGLMPFVFDFISKAKQYGIQDAALHAPSRFIPYDFKDKKFTTANLDKGLYPLLGGIALHKIVGQKLGVNRMLAQAGIPVIRL